MDSKSMSPSRKRKKSEDDDDGNIVIVEEAETILGGGGNEERFEEEEENVFTIVVDPNAVSATSAAASATSSDIAVEETAILSVTTSGAATDFDPCKNLLTGLVQEFSELNYCDCWIVCSDKRIIYTHKLILASISQFLYSILSSVNSEEPVVIYAMDFQYESLHDFIQKIYMGENKDEIFQDDVFASLVLNFGFTPNPLKFQQDVNKLQPIIIETAPPPRPPVVVPSVPPAVLGSQNLITQQNQKIEAAPQTLHPSEYRSKPLKKRSAIWNYFTKSTKVGWNTCNTCKKDVSGKSQNTSTMIRHLKLYHEAIYDEFKSHGPATETKAKNSTLTDAAKLPMGVKIKKLSDPETRTCADCMREFSSRGAMLHHWKAVHSGEKPFSCHYCNSAFNRLDTYKAHMTAHSSELPFLCSFCGKAFSRRNVRDMHERVHRDDRRYPCSFCDKKFFTNQQKRNHERTHTGEKPFRCSECPRTFSVQHQLTTHSRVHSGTRPYECENCLETFKYLSSKNKHTCKGNIYTATAATAETAGEAAAHTEVNFDDGGMMKIVKHLSADDEESAAEENDSY